MSRRTPVLLLLACLAVSLICVVYPIYVIRPFRAQGARELAMALMVMRLRLAITVVSGACAVAAFLLYWRVQPGRWRRALAAVGAAFVCLLGVLARVNVYELMFHPDDHPSFATASKTTLDKDEKVIAVRADNLARAYPIRSISYHHVINDILGKVGIVATY